MEQTISKQLMAKGQIHGVWDTLLRTGQALKAESANKR
jgi:hypothetical protein